MEVPMEPIYIPQLAKAPDQTESFQVCQHVPGFETLTPVQGQLSITHHGNYLEAKASVETIVTLACDRCLQNYNHRLQVEASELIWLDDTPDVVSDEGLEREVAVEDLVETLSPTGYIDPTAWLYEHLCLALPQRQLCDDACAGIQTESAVDESINLSAVDSRWASLAALKGQLLN